MDFAAWGHTEHPEELRSYDTVLSFLFYTTRKIFTWNTSSSSVSDPAFRTILEICMGGSHRSKQILYIFTSLRPGCLKIFFLNQRRMDISTDSFYSIGAWLCPLKTDRFSSNYNKAWFCNFRTEVSNQNPSLFSETYWRTWIFWYSCLYLFYPVIKMSPEIRHQDR